MNAKVISKANRILLLALCVVAAMLIIVFSVRASQRAKILEVEISKNHVIAESGHKFSNFADRIYEGALQEAYARIDDLSRIEEEDYRRLHVSMWDISYLTPEWFEIYYGSPVEYSNYIIKTPQELCDYIRTAVSVKPQLDYIYLGIDPYELYRNYYTSVYYDSEIATFEEYLENNLFPLFKENENINFRIFLPVKPLSALAEETDEEIMQTFKNWYIFLMYLRLYPNVKSVYMGVEEWLVCNDAGFNDDNTFTPETGKMAHLYMYNKSDYVITPPELDRAGDVAVSMAHKVRNGEYQYKGFESKKIVCFGDSVFDYNEQSVVSIPGFVEQFTSASCYNLSIGGATATKGSERSFPNVVKKLNQKEADGRDAERFFKEVNREDDMIFLIEYGLNDYFKNNEISEFEQGLVEGIELLKRDYPNSEIMLISPYRIGEANGGDDPYVDGGKPLVQYVDMMEDVSEEEEIAFLDLFRNSGITFDNSRENLEDGIHPTKNTNLYLARLIVENMVEQFNIKQ